MGRGKLALELIPKEKARRITYEKRKKGLMKKAKEFTTLCGVDTGMIIYGPAGSAAVAEPVVWPASPEKVKLVIERYRGERADDRAKRTVGLPEFFANRKRKVDAEFAKVRLANWEAKYLVSEALIEGLSEEDLRWLLVSLGHKLEAAKARLAAMKEDATKRFDHHIHADDHVYHHPHMHGLFQNQIVPIPMKQPPLDVNPSHLDLPYQMQQQHQQQSLFDPDSGNSSIPDAKRVVGTEDPVPEPLPLRQCPALAELPVRHPGGDDALGDVGIQPRSGKRVAAGPRPHAALNDAGRSDPDPDDPGFFAGQSSVS